ncbi:hypothetical protein HYU06_03490 [Candidatus Woesearchaeota archaeon]|nr:hypothetical protein [Candidatus Woesearchaeota archaeon]
MCDEFMKRYKKDKDYLDWLDKKSNEEKKPFFKYMAEQLNKMSKLNDEQLLTHYKKFANMFYFAFGASHLVEGISLTTDVVFKDLLLKALQKIGKVDKFTEYFTELTQPTRKMFFPEFNKSMLKMVEYYKKHQKENNRKEPSLEDKKLKALVDAHIKRFFWIKSQWDKAREYTADDVISEIKEAVDKNEQITITTDSQLKKNILLKKKLFKELNLSHELIDLVEITDFVTFWQDQRKIVILSGVYAFQQFVDEIAKRFKVDSRDLKYLLADEVNPDDVGSIKNTNLKERRKASIFIHCEDQLEVFTGDRYKEIKSMLVRQHKEDDVKELNGMCASLGNVTGKVKVCINAAEIFKVEKGDILVTSMTRPEFVPAMKRAAAIITDEGGITSHAAVISRELKIPCVIGTKIATKVLKDGDLVIVNANHGIVKILK